jgi:short-subunit dehydrogenase
MSNRGQSWALITGASSGFGVEFAKLAANDGYNLVIAARRIDKLEELAKEIKRSHNVEVVVVEIDLSMAENIS